MNVFWFRRDLRIEDNYGFFEVLQNSDSVLPVFIFDPAILDELNKDDARVSFINELLANIHSKLQEKGKYLAIFFDSPVTVFEKLASENKIDTVYTNHDYEPYARKRDLAVYQVLKKFGIEFKTCKDQVIFEKDEIVKDDGLPYAVFTPYARKWRARLSRFTPTHYPSEKFLDKIAGHHYPFLSLSDIGFKTAPILVPPADDSIEMIRNYAQSRNFPELKTSHLGPHLRFGALSIRKIVSLAMEQNNQTFLNELIWREFFMQILWHFPKTIRKSFKPKYDHIQWRNNEAEFEKWCAGKTGYPFVDAGMRELNATGFMHNRVRMITASFLCKHLLIDWRWGETYFAQKLLDYEQASNVGNWQWAAGSGVDAAPYFRIFNPSEQTKKFDKDLNYIRKWIPELDKGSYPEPIVDHKFARERCLQVYKKALS